MYELTEEQLEQVVGGYGFTGSSFGGGLAGATSGYGYTNSGAYSQTTPTYTYASGGNYSYANGINPFALGGAAANTTYHNP